MKKTGFFSGLFAVLAVAAAAAALYLTFANLNAPPVLVQMPDEAMEKVDAVMNAVCAGEYEVASAHMYGNPDLGVSREAADPVGGLIWDAFEKSLSWEPVGECFATDEGIARKVKLRSLDFASVTENLGIRAQTLLDEKVEAAEDYSLIYDENNEYREDFVMSVLYEAAQAAIREDVRHQEREFTLNLTYRDGRWWVMPEQDLIRAISGGIAG